MKKKIVPIPRYPLREEYQRKLLQGGFRLVLIERADRIVTMSDVHFGLDVTRFQRLGQFEVFVRTLRGGDLFYRGVENLYATDPHHLGREAEGTLAAAGWRMLHRHHIGKWFELTYHLEACTWRPLTENPTEVLSGQAIEV